MFDTIWSLKSEDFAGENEYISEEAYFEKILNERGILDIDSFLNPSLDMLCDPFMLPNIYPAIDRILEACDNHEKICVFGDYDADGVTSTAILYDFLKEQMEADVYYHIPNRISEGYGLSEKAVCEAHDFGATLIITVDNGISAAEAVAKANELEIDVVVTDHHEIPEILPKCVAIVNPHLPDSVYPTKNLCGAGVAFKLVTAISVSVGLDDYMKYLPFAAIGTVADVVELLGENRIIVKFGLEMIKESEFPGLLVLFDNYISSGRRIETDSIGYFIAPRINAAGRVDSAETACELLLSKQNYEAKELSLKLDKFNETRKETEDKTVNEAVFNKDNTVFDECAIIVKNYDWHSGILGIVAGRLLDKFQKPAIVLCKDSVNAEGKVVLKASARSNDTLNIIDIIQSVSGILVKFGGHPKAAGFSILEENLPEFVSALKNYYNAHSDEILLAPKKTAYAYMPPELITVSMCNKIDKLRPFGEGNKKPVFFTDGIVYVNPQTFCEEKHLKLTTSFSNGKNVEMIKFSSGEDAFRFTHGIKGGAMFTLGVNEFRGSVSVQPTVCDFIENYTQNVELNNSFSISEEDARIIFSQIKRLGGTFDKNSISLMKKAVSSATNLTNEQKNIFTWFKIEKCLEIFTELGYVEKTEKGQYRFTESVTGKKLSDSKLFRQLLR